MAKKTVLDKLDKTIKKAFEYKKDGKKIKGPSIKKALKNK